MVRIVRSPVCHLGTKCLEHQPPILVNQVQTIAVDPQDQRFHRAHCDAFQMALRWQWHYHTITKVPRWLPPESQHLVLRSLAQTAKPGTLLEVQAGLP